MLFRTHMQLERVNINVRWSMVPVYTKQMCCWWMNTGLSPSPDPTCKPSHPGWKVTVSVFTYSMYLHPQHEWWLLNSTPKDIKAQKKPCLLLRFAINVISHYFLPGIMSRSLPSSPQSDACNQAFWSPEVVILHSALHLRALPASCNSFKVLSRP